ncbi:MAG: hypothetical protein U0441_05035 [Polyangiaceae bacterium]
MTSLHRWSRVALVGALVLAGPLLCGSQALADGPPPAADPAKIEQAKKHMQAGAALYNDPSGHKCEEAYVEFNKAYELSGSLNALKNRAVCALELEKDGEAYLDYKKVLAGMSDKLGADEKTQIENDMKALEAAVAWVTIKLDVPTAKLVDVRTPSRGLPVSNRYAATSAGIKIGFHPGSHAITATTEDGKEITWKVDLTNGQTMDHTFEFSKLQTAPTATATATVAPTATATATATATSTGEQPGATRPTPMSVWVTLGLTGLFAVGTGVTMGLAGAAKSDFDKGCTFVDGKCVDNGTVKDLAGARSNVQTMNLVADISLGATAIAGVTTLVLYLTRPKVNAEGPAKTGLVVAPAIGPNVGGVTAVGHF